MFKKLDAPSNIRSAMCHLHVGTGFKRH